MEDLLFLIVVEFLIDFCVTIFAKKINNLHSTIFHVLALQILTICATLTFYYLHLKVNMFFVFKFLAYFFICLISTESYHFGKFFKLFFSMIIAFFSVSGFIYFEISVIDVSFGQFLCIYDQNIKTLVEVLCLTLYLFLIYGFARVLSKNKYKRDFIAQVSFFAFGQHIKLKGLMDSGNSLYDSVTGLPVIVVEKNTFEKCLASKLDTIKILRKISCVSIGLEKIVLPIVCITKVQIVHNKNIQNTSVAIAVIPNSLNFDKSKFNGFDCLLHRDFL